MADKEETGSNIPHWSGTFQRLRAETIVLSFTIAAASMYGLNPSKKIPLLGWEFVSDIPQWLLIGLLYAFWLYFLFAWVVRFQRERLTIVAGIDTIRNAETSILALIADLKDPDTTSLATFMICLERAIAEVSSSELSALEESLDRAKAEAFTKIENMNTLSSNAAVLFEEKTRLPLRQLNNLKASVIWDTYILGFGIPVAVSLILVVGPMGLKLYCLISKLNCAIS